MMHDSYAADYGIMETDTEMYQYYPSAFSVVKSYYLDGKMVDVGVLHSSGIDKGEIGRILSASMAASYIEAHCKTLSPNATIRFVEDSAQNQSWVWNAI